MQQRKTTKQVLHQIIFEADTPAGKAFDVGLIVAILLSVLVVALDSVAELALRYGPLFRTLEWFFTVLFTVEYFLRLYSSPRPVGYARSVYGIIDLLSIVPTYLSMIFPAGRFLLTIRILRVLRVFRVLKLARFVTEGSTLGAAIHASRYKIGVFLAAVLAIVVVIGSLMYIIEGEASGFDNIPISIYWTIVTLTTVGYGDIAPQTPLGQALASLVMITGFGIIAVPTGIVTLEIGRASERARASVVCPACGLAGHEPDAHFCRRCGSNLHT